MPPATIPPRAASSTSSGTSSAMAWLKTKEGKIAATAAAGLLVVVLALSRRGGTAGAGFSPAQLATGPDKTLQDRLDQVGFRGGTLEEWISATTGLSGEVGQLRDLIDAGNQLPPSAPEPVHRLQRIGQVGTSYDPRHIAAQYAPDQTNPHSVELTLREIIGLNVGRTDYVPLAWGPGATIPGGYPLLVPRTVHGQPTR